LWLVHCSDKWEIRSDFPLQTTLPVTAGWLLWKEEAAKLPGAVNPGGNRRLNWALYIMAMVRLRVDDGRSRQFIVKQADQGNTKRADSGSSSYYGFAGVFVETQ